MNESHPPSFAQLLDWLEGRLSEEEARALAEQLQTADEATRADLAWLREFHQARQDVKLTVPPPRVREALKRRFADYAGARRPPGSFRRWLAALTFDSRTRLGVVGLRSAATEGLQRQLIYTTGVADVVLNIQPHSHEQSFNLTGQVFPTTDVAHDGFSIQLLREETEVGLVTADELGEFSFEAVPPGEYEIVVSGDQSEIVLPAFQLRP
ncbi:MAG: hypothetical protein ACRDH2_17985 [Anaerolineales bacterium]